MISFPRLPSRRRRFSAPPRSSTSAPKSLPRPVIVHISMRPHSHVARASRSPVTLTVRGCQSEQVIEDLSYRRPRPGGPTSYKLPTIRAAELLPLLLPMPPDTGSSPSTWRTPPARRRLQRMAARRLGASGLRATGRGPAACAPRPARARRGPRVRAAVVYVMES